VGVAPWAQVERPASPASRASRPSLALDDVSGDWRFARRQDEAQLQIEQLALSREEKDAPLPRISVELAPNHIHGDVANAPLSSAARVASWLAPQLVPDDLELKGTLQDIDVDWNAARPEGERLAASAHASEARIGSRSQGLRLDGLRTRFIGSESRVTVELSAHAAKLERDGAAAPLEGLKVASALEWRRVGDGWSLALP